MPQFGRAYAAGRLATSSLRPLARFVNTLPSDLPVVTQQLQLGRTLRPFLESPDRLQLFGGRPGRIDPLPTIAAAGPFLYVYTNADDAELAAQVAADYACEPRPTLVDWELWFCNGATLPTVANFEQGITLAAAATPLHAADILPVTLFWQADAPIPQEYTVFVHVVDANGTMVGQWDQTPGAGESPTTTWSPGRLIVDDYQIPLQRSGCRLPLPRAGWSL